MLAHTDNAVIFDQQFRVALYVVYLKITTVAGTFGPRYR